MAEKNAGMRSSLSADDVGKSSKKPGKISADFLAQFESDPALSGSSSSLQFPRGPPGHGSSSDMASTSASHENLAPARRPNVRISEPPHSSNEEMATGIDHDPEYDEKTEKKRKSIWKWGPLKKVRKFFSRKKNTRKAKSCEDLPVSSTGFRPIGSQERLAVDESQRYRTSSSGPLQHEADVHSKSSPVMRSRSMPPQSPNTAHKEAKKRQASSHEEIREERSPNPVSKTYSLPSLHGTGIRSLRDVYTEEAAVSFESDPHASSIEGLQAAHDKIKAAPKKRRPPTRARSRTSSLGVGDTPDNKDPKAHKRSITDPTDLTRERTYSGNRLDSSSMSDFLNNTIFETEDEEGQTVTSPQASQRDKDQEDSVREDIMSKVNTILAQTSGPSRLSEGGSPSPKLRASKVDFKKTTEKEDSGLGSQSKETTDEKGRSFPDRNTIEYEGSELDRTLKEMSEKKELTVAEKRRSFPEKTTVEEGFKKRELTVAEKRRSFTDNKTGEKEKLEWGKTAKESFEKKETTAQEKRRSFTEQKSQESMEKIEKSFPKKENVSGFAQSIRSSRAESEVVVAENTCQLENEVTFEDFEFDKILDSGPTTSKQSTDDSKKDSKLSPKKEETQQKDTTKPVVPFKRGKSWSNNHKTKFQEFPFKLDSVEPDTAKKESQTNILTEKREFVPRQEQGIRKEEKKSDTSEESVTFRFSRTKSWSYGTKPGDVRKANAKENQVPAVENEKEMDEEPSWVANAKQKSRRISLLLQDDETSENQTPTLVKTNKNNINKPPDSKPQTSPKPKLKSPAKSNPNQVIQKEPFKAPVRPSKPPVATKEQVTIPTREKPSKPFVIVKQEQTQPKLTSNLYGRSSATLPARTDKNITGTAVEKKNSRQSLNLSSQEATANKKPFGGVKIEKCIVCGTTVYQMEKCKFDDSVLHRNCIKCTVCKRHLTVGNFVMAESKIYCKPHSHTVTVST